MAEPETAQEFTALYASNHPRVYAYAVARAGRALGVESRVLRPAGTTVRLKAGSLIGYSVVLDQKTTDETPPN